MNFCNSIWSMGCQAHKLVDSLRANVNKSILQANEIELLLMVSIIDLEHCFREICK